ncbi:MAG: hypothetical protein PUC18_02560 [Prevotellaceae bacterium]|nr:hypothetical protein [Prevotellaceae bacterium]
MNKYVIISIEESGQFGNFQSSILVKVNPVQVVNFGFRDLGQYVAHECDETLWLLFRNSQITGNLVKLKNYARACESGVFLELDIDNWFEEREIIVHDNGELHSQIIYVSLDHDEYFDEMDYYYQTHANEAYSKWEEEQYIAQQRRRRDAGLMYDDYIDSLDEEDEWDY